MNSKSYKLKLKPITWVEAENEQNVFYGYLKNKKIHLFTITKMNDVGLRGDEFNWQDLIEDNEYFRNKFMYRLGFHGLPFHESMKASVELIEVFTYIRLHPSIEEAKKTAEEYTKCWINMFLEVKYEDQKLEENIKKE